MPLLGSYGGSSEYAYRGTIDDFPDDFSFNNQANATPGDLFTSNQITITGINNRAIVKVSAGASVSINGGSYVIPTEASPVFIKNNETISVRIPSTIGQRSDFEKIYTARVSVGKKSTIWEVRTKAIDDTPTPFTFTNLTNREIGVGYTSNEIIVSGLEPGFSFPATITSGSAQLIRNGGVGIAATNIVNGDRIYLNTLSPFEYTNFPTGSGTKTNSTSIQVGNYSTTWSVSTREPDVFVDPFDFPDEFNARFKSEYTAEIVTVTGVSTTTTATITLTSSTVSSGSSAPNSIYQTGAPSPTGAANTNPQISWSVSGLPPGVEVRDYAIFLEDLSSFTRFIHWNLTGIGSTSTSIGFGTSILPSVATVGPTSWPNNRLNSVGYGGPQPPINEKHTYRLTIRANLTGAGTTSVLVKGINFFAGAGVSIGNRLTPLFPDQSTVVSGILTNRITGADQNIPLVTAVSGCTLTVIKPDTSVRSVGTANTLVFNGDKLLVNLTSGDYSETKIGIVTVSNFTGRFIVTTRPRPIDTIPDTFTFVDLPAAKRGPNSIVESNEITLVGMSTFNDEGDAGITTGTNGGDAQYQVTRGAQIVKPFNSLPFKVREGDKIKLKIGVSSEPNITRTATFRVDGIDTNTVITGQTGAKDDIWSVTAAPRNCGVTSFTLPTLNNVNRLEQQTTVFTPDGFDSDCRMVISVTSSDGGNPTLSVASTTSTNNIPILPGTPVTLRMTSGDFGQTRTAIVTISNTSTSVVPQSTLVTNWVVNTTADNRATSISISASPNPVELGKTSRITWTSINAATVVSSTGFPSPSPSTVNGFVDVTPTIIGDQEYTITVQGPPIAPNFNNPPVGRLTLTTGPDVTPDDFTLNPSSLSNQNRSAEVSATAQSSTNSSVSVTGLTNNTTVTATVSGSASGFTVNSGSRVTSASVRNSDIIRVFMTNSSSAGQSVTGTLNIGSKSASFTSTTTACTPTTSSASYANGTVTVNFKTATVQPAISGVTTPALYTSRSGGGLSQPCKANSTGQTFFTNTENGQTADITIPDGVTQIQLAVVGGGGGGTQFKGGGGGGFARQTIPVSGGQRITLQSAAQPSSGGQPGANSQVLLNGVRILLGIAGAAGNVGGRGGGFQPDQADGRGGQTSGNPGGSQDIANTRPQGQFGTTSSNQTGGSGGGVRFGNGTSFITLIEVVGQNGSGAGGASNGTTASTGGGGGGGNGVNPFGSTNPTFSRGGGGCAAALYQTQGVAAPTWDQLIQAIVDQFNTSFNRPPRDTEISTYISSFTNNASLTLDGLRTAIANSGTPRATSFTDSCGSGF